MMTILQMHGFPNGTPIDSVQARIAKVYEHKTIAGGQYGPTTVQNAVIEDVGGNKIKLKVWGHPDISKLEGQEVVIHAAHNGKGLAIEHNSYQATKGAKAGTTVNEVLLTVQKNGQFQTVAVYHANAGTKTETGGQVAPKSVAPIVGAMVRGEEHPAPIHPATAGMATNKALDVLIEAGVAYEMANQGKLTEAIFAIGSQIAAGAIMIEKGVKVPAAKPSPPKAKETAKAEAPESVAPKADPNTGEAPPEDVPW